MSMADGTGRRTTSAAESRDAEVRARLEAAVARREYLPSTVTGKPDVPPRQKLTAFDWLEYTIEGFKTIIIGHIVTLINFFRKKVTERYPFHDPERNWKPWPGYRGDFALITDRERGRLRCTACMQCANICPTKCIWIVGEGKGRDRGPAKFNIDAGLCMYCWLCVEVCPFKAITMTPDYETSAPKAEYLIRDLEHLRTRGLEYPEVLLAPEVDQATEVGPLAAGAATDGAGAEADGGEAGSQS